MDRLLALCNLLCISFGELDRLDYDFEALRAELMADGLTLEADLLNEMVEEMSEAPYG